MKNGNFTDSGKGKKVAGAITKPSSTQPSIKSIWPSCRLVALIHLGKWTLKDLSEAPYIKGSLIFAYANTAQWNDAKYGTRALPMPIFFIKATHLYNNQLTIGPWDSSSSPCIIDYNSTRKFVEQYLAYFLPEEEFDRLFKGKEK